MNADESRHSGDTAKVTTHAIHHVAIDGQGSATIVEFHCEGECHRLLVRVVGNKVSAEWVDEDVAKRFRTTGP